MALGTNDVQQETLEVNNHDKNGIDIDFKRVIARAQRYWYLVILSIAGALAIALAVNRYSNRIYTVKASIIIRETDENAGAKFLYNNDLVNPYRNFLNEIYIMKSYPLLKEVMQELNFDVAYYREGEIKSTEFYSPGFPVFMKIVPGEKAPYGMSMNFIIRDSKTFSLEYLNNDDGATGKEFEGLIFNDTVRVNGYRFYVGLRTPIDKEMIGKQFIVRFQDPLTLARSYSTRLKANWAQQGASVVDLEINGPVAQKEIDFLNKFIEKYQEYDVNKKNSVASKAIDFLDLQLKVIGDSLNRYERKVEQFKRKNVVTDIQAETQRLYLQLEDLEKQQFQFQLQSNYYGYVVKLLQNEQYEGIFTPSSVGISDDVIAALISALIQTRSELSHYEGVERTEEIPGYKDRIRRLAQIKSDILKTIENSRKTQSINRTFISDQIHLIENRLSLLPQTERELVAIKRNYSLRENLYVFLLQKRAEAGLSQASTTSDIVVVNPPLQMGGSISPKENQNLGIALGIGILLPLLVFLIMEVLNTRIQSREDIEKITRVPVIGGVGHNSNTENLVVYKKPRSVMAESFRSLRSNLSYFTGNKNHQLFMVTSSIPNEGKTFTTLNLACVLAMAGKKTLIIGADLRRPKLFDDFGATNDVGLTQYLSQMATLEEITQKTFVENLSLIPAGPMPPNPSELLLTERMDEVMRIVKEKYDFIVMDTPPLSLVTDAFILSKYANHTLFVVRQNYTPKPALAALHEFYVQKKIVNMSILFNDLGKSGLGYGYNSTYGYGYSYRYGYSYGFGSKKQQDTGGYYSED